MDNVIKSFNIDGVKHTLNLSEIGAFIGQEGKETELKAYIDSHSGGGGGDATYYYFENGTTIKEGYDAFVAAYNEGGIELATEKVKFRMHNDWGNQICTPLWVNFNGSGDIKIAFLHLNGEQTSYDELYIWYYSIGNDGLCQNITQRKFAFA